VINTQIIKLQWVNEGDITDQTITDLAREALRELAHSHRTLQAFHPAAIAT
jgi:hypothetical protein